MRSIASPALLLALASSAAAGEGEIRLFNGKDLTGWTYFLEKKGTNADGSKKMADVWSADAERGVIRCSGTPNGYIRTTGDYTSFVLRLEWRWPEKPGHNGRLPPMGG